MNVIMAARPSGGLSSLRRLAGRAVVSGTCDLCGTPLADPHAHLVDPAARRLLCACPVCATLGHGESARFKSVPTAIRALDGFRLSNAEWDALHIPIGLAFFMRRSPAGDVCLLYPSPAGAVESQLPLDRWTSIVGAHDEAGDLEPDIEALLVNRLTSPNRPAPLSLVVPIDVCYRLVGLIRMHWRGLGGGSDLWAEVDRFFVELVRG